MSPACAQEFVSSIGSKTQRVEKINWDKAENKWLVIDARLSTYLSPYLLVAEAQRGKMY